MKDVRVPGVLWAIMIIVIVALVHGNAEYIQAAWGIEPWVIDLGLTLLIAGLKSTNLGTEQLNQALDIIDQILSRKTAGPGPGMRSAAGPEAMPLVVEKVPQRPNALTAWLLG